MKFQGLVSMFPPPEHLSPVQLARLFLAVHPSLAHLPFQAWAILSRQTVDVGLGELGSPSMTEAIDDVGLLGYSVSSIEREDETTGKIIFKGPPGLPPVTALVPAGSKAFRPFAFTGKLEFRATRRFTGLLTCLLQAHALGWDISFVPPPLPSTASSSTSILVKVFGQILGYETDTIHMYKELGGRELIMRRKIESSGSTTWEPR
jgi:hypothetical protein